MREIKFRAWGPNTRHMWSNEELRGTALCYLFESQGDLIPMQFTGLRDKNGREIYEGDYFDSGQWGVKGVVTFGEFEIFDGDRSYQEHYGWYLYWCGEYVLNADLAERGEIIGNIHENGNLLEQK